MLYYLPMINAEVTRNPNENALGVIRRFTRKVQGSGIIQRKRGLRFAVRTQSHYKVKMKTLKGINNRAKLAELVKLGKAPVKPERGGRK
jgi:gamma-glutamyl:cysteine ligase YbdK (ATP-grasp superfamily)